LVTSHCFTSEGARNAMEGGVGCIEHGSLIDEDTLRLMAKKGVHLVPTCTIQELIVNGPMGKFIPAVSLAKAKRVATATYRMMKTAHEVGVNIGYGTDSPGEVQLAEFGFRQQVFSSPVILQQATCNGAKILGKEGKLGVIKEGAFADFLLLGFNPLEDVSKFNEPKKYLKAVVKDGRCVKSEVDGLKVEISLQ